jgi:hypothetical protein
MQFIFRGNGDGFVVHIEVHWPAATALLKAAIATLLVVSALLAALAHLGS